MKNLILPDQIMRGELVFIDFEFRSSNEKHVVLVSACLFEPVSKTTSKYWLFEEPTKQAELKARLISLARAGHIFVAYSAVAEARCFMALGLDPVDFEWIDLMLEHKQLINSYDKLGYGKQMINGRVVTTKNETKWGKTEEQLARMNRSKPQTNLVSAAYKFAGQYIDSQNKKDTIDLILKSETFNANQRRRILDYCAEDTLVLAPIFRNMLAQYSLFWATRLTSLKKQPRLDLKKAMHLRGRYASLTAHQVSRGYPVNKLWFEKFLAAVPDIYQAVRVDVMSQFDEYVPFLAKVKKRPDELSFSVLNVRKWIVEKSGHADKWPKTETGALSLASSAWEKFYSFKHDYPRGNYAAQIMRWFSFKKSMAGFAESAYEDSKILEYYGSDARIRPYMGIYSSQTARSQPNRSFIPLKTAWSRSLIYQADPKKFLCSIDYGSQEVLVQAIVSSDDALFESYVSGDVYLDFAKKAGAVPADGTKKTHALERATYKTAFLAIGYGVGSRTLANQITSQTGRACSEDEAQVLIDQFYEVYWKYRDFLSKTKEDYGFDSLYDPPSGKGFLQLPCGWYLGGNNLSHRSCGNFLIQGTGSSILREAVWLCYKKNLPVIYTLHDAVTCELESLDQIRDLYTCMRDAFITIMSEFTDNKLAKAWAKKIRLDTNCWGAHFLEHKFSTDKIKQQHIYIDERAKESFDFYKPYFMGEVAGVD